MLMTPPAPTGHPPASLGRKKLRQIFRCLAARHALQRGAMLGEEAADAGCIAPGEFAQPPADRLLDEPLAIVREPRRPAQHPLRVAAVACPGKGEDKGGPPR